MTHQVPINETEAMILLLLLHHHWCRECCWCWESSGYTALLLDMMVGKGQVERREDGKYGLSDKGMMALQAIEGVRCQAELGRA
jgi:hypothetical protein